MYNAFIPHDVVLYILIIQLTSSKHHFSLFILSVLYQNKWSDMNFNTPGGLNKWQECGRFPFGDKIKLKPRSFGNVT